MQRRKCHRFLGDFFFTGTTSHSSSSIEIGSTTLLPLLSAFLALSFVLSVARVEPAAMVVIPMFPLLQGLLFDIDDKPDKWIIDFRPDMDLYSDFSANIYITTFSNSPCWPDYCLRQSYQENLGSG